MRSCNRKSNFYLTHIEDLRVNRKFMKEALIRADSVNMEFYGGVITVKVSYGGRRVRNEDGKFFNL